MAVVHAPTPKKKMKNPGITSSSTKNTMPMVNQNTSGLEKISVIIVIYFKKSNIRKNIIIITR
jgi:hypothetical protein